MRFRKKNTKVFGVPVEEAANKSVLKNGIPLPLTRCIDTIEREALTLEGVYRRTGDLGDVDRIIKLYNAGKDPDLLPYDPFVLTSLLKKYFTLLPEPITTFELYERFIAAKKAKERPDKVKGVRELVMKLPDSNRFILYFLIQHLVRVSKHSGENKMSTTNLSIVFGPTLFRSTDNSSARLLADAGHLGGCVEIMISNFDRVFDFMLPNVQISVNDDEEMKKLMSSSADLKNSNKRGKETKAVPIAPAEPIPSHTDVISIPFSLPNNRNLLLQDEDHNELKKKYSRATITMGAPLIRGGKEFNPNTIQLNFGRKAEETEMVDLASSPIGDGSLELDEEAFQKELNAIEIDLDAPLAGVTARIEMIKKRLGLADNAPVQNMTPKDREVEKTILKRELTRFTRVWERERKRNIDRLAKLPLKPLYDRYRSICEVQVATKSNGSFRASYDGSVTRKNAFQFVSPLSPEEYDRSSERSMMIGLKLQDREEYMTTKTKKSELKRKLHQFQDDFIKQHGRRVLSKSDKIPVEKEYDEYKKLKQWIKDKEEEVASEVDNILV